MLETLAFTNLLPLFIYLLHVDKRSIYYKRFFFYGNQVPKQLLIKQITIVKRFLRATIKHCPVGVL